MVGKHHWHNGHEFEQTPGDSGKQRSLVCYSPMGRKESDTTERLHFHFSAWSLCSQSGMGWSLGQLRVGSRALNLSKTPTGISYSLLCYWASLPKQESSFTAKSDLFCIYECESIVKSRMADALARGNSQVKVVVFFFLIKKKPQKPPEVCIHSRIPKSRLRVISESSTEFGGLGDDMGWTVHYITYPSQLWSEMPWQYIKW